jgi:hypothetical protein
LQRRIEALEIRHRTLEDRQEPTPEQDPIEFLCRLFTTKQLWFDQDGMVIVGPVGAPADKEELRPLVEALNERKAHTVLIPLSPGELDEAIEALQDGRLRVAPVMGVNGQFSHYHMEMGYLPDTGWAMDKNYLAYLVNRAIDAVEAQTGEPFEMTTEKVADLLQGARAQHLAA